MSSPKPPSDRLNRTCDRCNESYREDSRPIDAQVREQISRLLPSEPTIMAVAKALDISVRTLQRRLAANDLSYRQLLDRIRRKKAEAELISRSRSVAEIAQRLGYSDPSHFVRAFRRWTGYPPSHFADARNGSRSQTKEA